MRLGGTDINVGGKVGPIERWKLPRPVLCSVLFSSPVLSLINPHSFIMAHRRGYSHHLDMGKISFDTPPLTPPLAVLNEFQASMSSTARKPKQYWQRTTFLALFTLVVVSIYVLLVSQPSLSPISMPQGGDKSFASIATQRLSRLSEKAHRFTAIHRKHPQGTTKSTSEADATTDTLPSLQLTPEQELAAVTTFLASLPQNVIPSNVDPSKPIDPQLVLDFDTRNPQALTEIAQLEHDAWVRYPVVFYSKVRALCNYRVLDLDVTDLDALSPFAGPRKDYTGT